MRNWVAWASPAFAIVGVILAIFIGNNGWDVLSYKDNMPVEGTKVAGALFVVAVFMERSLAVLNDLLFGEKIVDAESKLRVAKMSAGIAADKSVLTSVWELNSIDAQKQHVRLGVGFVFAVLIAAAGVRTFTGLLDLDGLDGNQRTLLDTMDILLTAGLLAGGSSVIAQIIDLLRDRAQGAKERQLLMGNPGDDALAPALAARMQRAGLLAQGSNLAATTLSPRTPRASGEYDFVDVFDDGAAFKEWRQLHESAGSAEALTTTSWRVAGSLKKLKAQLNAAFPNRSTASDGDIGDSAHCANGGTSDHCPHVIDGTVGVVTAFDATHDPANGCDMEVVVEAIRAAKDLRIKYIIWNSRICSSYPVGTAAAWDWRPYSGQNPHDKHAHFSVLADKPKYDSQTNWTIA